jgi:hypothetical protein
MKKLNYSNRSSSALYTYKLLFGLGDLKLYQRILTFLGDSNTPNSMNQVKKWVEDGHGTMNKIQYFTILTITIVIKKFKFVTPGNSSNSNPTCFDEIQCMQRNTCLITRYEVSLREVIPLIDNGHITFNPIATASHLTDLIRGKNLNFYKVLIILCKIC